MRKVNLVMLIILLLLNFSYAEQICPYVGAIRWDAWHGDMSEVGKYEEKSLSKEKWHYRLPFCSQILNSKVKINCATPEAVKEEIEYATYGMLDYWAFVVYPFNKAMNENLMLYLKDKEKDNIKFSIIVPFNRWSPANYEEINSYYVNFLKQNNYLKIDHRPVIFIFNIDERTIEKLWEGEKKFKKVVESLTFKSIQEGIGKPFYVVMDFNPEKAAKWVDTFGFDAISTYATNCGRQGSYQELTECAFRWWERAKKTGKEVIPIVMAGWDPRPRGKIPAPWATDLYTQKAKEVFYTNPKPKEIAEHLRKAITWAKENNSRAIIIYAWNEFSEGGWIMPTLFEDAERLKAIREVMIQECGK